MTAAETAAGAAAAERRDRSAPATDLQWRRCVAHLALTVTLCLPLIALAIAHRLWVRKRVLIGLREKLTGDGPPTPAGRFVVHGVSMGEVALMRPLMPTLDRLAGGPCVLTTTSETGHQALARHFPDHPCRSFPLDLPWAGARFLQRTRPRALVLMELELWPLLLAACHARGIRVVVVNARCSARSFRGYRAARSLLGPLLRPLIVLAQNPTWAARLRALGCGEVQVTGSLKADVVRPADEAAREAEAARLGLVPGPAHDKKILLLASTGPGEEHAGLNWWCDHGRAAGWRLVICPRHPERGSEISAHCQRREASWIRTSRGPLPISDRSSVIIVDEIGRLAALYANAAIAVVGGSLGSGRGGQNMLEAAAAGCATVVGLDTRNQPDAMALLRARDAVIETTPEVLGRTLSQLSADPERCRALGERARQAWEDGRGAIERTLRALEDQLDPTRPEWSERPRSTS